MGIERIIRRNDTDVLHPQHTALLVIDGTGEAYQNRIPTLVNSARDKGVLIIFSEYCPIHTRGKDNTLYSNDALSLASKHDIRIPRINYSCFFGNCLHETLQENHIETLLICGGDMETTLYTSICEAQYHDYYACVATDTANKINEDTSECALALMKKRYRCLSVQDIINIWRLCPTDGYYSMGEEKNNVSNENTALIVVDMQKDFCYSDGEYAKTRDVSAVLNIVPVIQRLVQSARSEGVPVFFFRQITPPADLADNGASLAFKTRDGKKPNYALEGSRGSEYINEINILPEEVVVPKLRSNGFHETYIEKILRANRITKLVFAGTQTEGCVLSSMMGAEQNGFCVIGAEDALATSIPDIQEKALSFMRFRFLLQPSDTIIAEWKKNKC